MYGSYCLVVVLYVVMGLLCAYMYDHLVLPAVLERSAYELERARAGKRAGRQAREQMRPKGSKEGDAVTQPALATSGS